MHAESKQIVNHHHHHYKLMKHIIFNKPDSNETERAQGLLLTLLPVEELGTLVRNRADRLLCFQQSIAIIRGQCQIKVNQTLIES